MSFKRKMRRLWLRMYMKVVREKATPEYIARGWAIGMFYGCFIPFGFQLICSIPTAFLLKGSKIGATVGTFFTNHFSVFIIYPAQCWVGNKIMGGALTWDAAVRAMQELLKEQSYQALLALAHALLGFVELWCVCRYVSYGYLVGEVVLQRVGQHEVAVGQTLHQR